MNAAVILQLLRGTLRASPLRLALTLACIALGVALAGAVHTIHASALAEVDRAARALSGQAEIEIRGPRSGFDDALFARIAARPEVAAASPVLELDAALGDPGRGTLRVLGIDPFRAMAMQPAFVAHVGAASAAGAPRLLDAKAAWLTQRAASRLGLDKGAGLRLVSGTRIAELQVAGVLEGLGAGAEAAVVDIAAAQALFGRVGLLSRIEVRLKAGSDEARWRSEVAAMLPPGVSLSPAASVSGRAAEVTRAYRVNLDALALVALATGAFLVFSTLALQAARRRQEFALLRALGLTRRGLAALMGLEGALVGAAGAALGIVIALAGSRLVLARAGADLGAGYFAGHAGAFSPDPAGLAAIALIAVAMAVGGALRVAQSVGRMPVAEALRDRAIDLPQRASTMVPAGVLAVAGAPLLLLPAFDGLPLGGYAAIALWLAAAVVAVAPLCRSVLARIVPRAPVAALALAQLRHLPGHLTASIAGIVVSASLCVAMAIMVFSFRVSFEEWLRGVVGADLYVRAALEGDTGFFTRAEQEAVASVPGVRRADFIRYDRLVVGAGTTPFTLVARPIDERILRGFQVEPRGPATRGHGERLVWITEAARDLHGWNTGERIGLPLAGRSYEARVAGVVRDYGRTWGAALVPIEDYRAATGDERVNDIALHLAPGADPEGVQRAVRAALPGARSLAIEDAAGIVRRSLEIFHRSFAVTYALEAIAIAIGLAGVTSSFAALAWSRRREFGVLRFLGLTRRDVLRMLALEGAAAGAIGALVGLAAGVAISAVLVHVVNRQSFHWSLTLHWPVAIVALFLVALVALCALAARMSGAHAVRREAILAVKDDA